MSEAEHTKLGQIPTYDLIKELSSRQGVQTYNAGLYMDYEIEVKKKYSEARESIQLPQKYTALIIDSRVWD